MIPRLARLTLATLMGATLLAGTTLPASAQTSNLDDLVAQFYPPLLESLALEVRSEVVRKQCYAVLQANASGDPTVVVAGYTNVIIGAVRVLVRDGSGFRVAAESETDDLAGSSCAVHRIDVNQDGVPEAHVEFNARNATIDWVYSWDGQVLTNLTPVTTDPISGDSVSVLINGIFVDTNGDSVLEAYSSDSGTGDNPPTPGRLYQLSGGRYVFDRSIVEVSQFERLNETPKTESVVVTLPVGAQGPFTLRVFNGAGVVGKRIDNAVESGRIWLNGQEIVRPNDFGNQVAVIERVVTLQPQNTLQVRLAGTPGGRISIVIDATSWAP